MKKIFILFFTTLLTSCASTNYGVWPYPLINAKSVTTAHAHTVTVLPFEDQRPNDQKGSLWKAYIPFIPSSEKIYTHPEKSIFGSTSYLNLNAREDLAKALTAELEVSKLFKQVSYSDKADSDYILKGRVISIQRSDRVYTYGISFFSSLVHIFGARFFKIHDTITISLELVDTKTKNILWNYKIENDTTRKLSIYSINKKKELFFLQDALRAGYREAITSLEQQLAKY